MSVKPGNLTLREKPDLQQAKYLAEIPEQGLSTIHAH
jgi:hypothetical protein